MADSKITELLELTAPTGGDWFPVVDIDAVPATTKKIKFSNMRQAWFVNSTMGATQVTGAVNGTFLTLNFTSDFASSVDTFIDRPTTSRFRALVAGWYRFTYQAYAYPAANNKSAELRLLKNGATAIAGSKMQMSQGQATATVGCFASKVCIVQLAVGDYIELQAAPTDATTMTFLDFTTICMEYIK